MIENDSLEWKYRLDSSHSLGDDNDGNVECGVLYVGCDNLVYNTLLPDHDNEE